MWLCCSKNHLSMCLSIVLTDQFVKNTKAVGVRTKVFGPHSWVAKTTESNGSLFLAANFQDTNPISIINNSTFWRKLVKWTRPHPFFATSEILLFCHLSRKSICLYTYLYILNTRMYSHNVCISMIMNFQAGELLGRLHWESPSNPSKKQNSSGCPQLPGRYDDVYIYIHTYLYICGIISFVYIYIHFIFSPYIYLRLYLHYMIYNYTMFYIYIHCIVYIYNHMCTYIYIYKSRYVGFIPGNASSHSKAEPFEPLRSFCFFKSTTLLVLGIANPSIS